MYSSLSATGQKAVITECVFQPDWQVKRFGVEGKEGTASNRSQSLLTLQSLDTVTPDPTTPCPSLVSSETQLLPPRVLHSVGRPY